MSALLSRLVLVTALSLAAVAGVRAEALRSVVDELVDAPVPEVAINDVNTAARARFDAALAVYDRHIEQLPSDVIARLNRCRFMTDFASNYELADFASEIADAGEECMTQFQQSYPGHPEAQLQQLQNHAYEEVLGRGEALLAQAQERRTWTEGQLGRLYALLAQTADDQGDSAKALKYSLLAVEIDEESDVRLLAATQLLARGNKERALEILRLPLDDFADGENGWQLSHKMKLLAQAGASQDAVALYPSLQKMRYYDHGEIAQLLLAAGAIPLARQELESAVKDSRYSTRDEGALFRLELDHGTAQAAFAAYQTWRDLGWEVDPLGINRVALLVRDASLPLEPRDFLGMFTFGGLCWLLALLAGLPVAAVHYRGLIARARSGEPYPQSEWSLRAAWLALSAFLITSVLALYFAGALDLRFDSEALWDMEPTPAQFSRMGMAGSLLAILALLPFATRLRGREGTGWSMHWSIGKCLGVAAAIAIGLRLPLLIAWAARPDAVQTFLPDDVLWQMLGGVQQQFGIAAAVWIVAIAAPVTEEFLFRGLLYRSFAVHLRPLWANVVQAALFSAMHVANVQGTILLFVLGLTLGTVTRRSGGLLAAITLHALFNLILALIVLPGRG